MRLQCSFAKHSARGSLNSRLTEVAGSAVALETRVAVTLLSTWIAESVLHALSAVVDEFVAACSRGKTLMDNTVTQFQCVCYCRIIDTSG